MSTGEAGPLYPNQQLKSVSIETFFGGQLSVLGGLADVQARFREELPQLFVPNAQEGEALALRPYQLRNAKSTRSLAIALNQATYIGFDYPGFQEFFDEALPVLSEALNLLGISDLQRVAYRYENEIGIARDERLRFPIGSVLRLEMPAWCGSEFTEIDFGWQCLWEKGQIGTTVRIEHANGFDVLKISLVAVVVPAGPVALLSDHVKLAHNEARVRFESMITEEFRKYISRSVEDGANG
jgi:uncharacterized protein (TIGR04255 family)